MGNSREKTTYGVERLRYDERGQVSPGVNAHPLSGTAKIRSLDKVFSFGLVGTIAARRLYRSLFSSHRIMWNKYMHSLNGNIVYYERRTPPPNTYLWAQSFYLPNGVCVCVCF